MSAVRIQPIHETEEIAPSRAQKRHTVSRPAAVRNRSASKRAAASSLPRRSQSALGVIAGTLALLAFVAAVAYTVSTLLGEVMIEKARKDATVARARTTEARRAETVLRDRVEALTRLDRIEGWAKADGLVFAGVRVEEPRSTLVAGL